MPTRLSLALALALSLSPAAAVAEGFDDLARIEVLPGWRDGPARHVAALRIEVAPGWKTYWRSPGAAGIPPSFAFDGSRNIAAVAPHFPVPHVFDQGGTLAIGYAEEVILPLDVALAGPGAARLAGEVEIGVCAEICVPMTLPFAADLPAAAPRDPAIEAALADRPLTAQEALRPDARCRLTPTARGLSLSLTLPDAPMPQALVVELPDPSLWISTARPARAGTSVATAVEVQAMEGGAVVFQREDLRITTLDANGAVEYRGCAPE